MTFSKTNPSTTPSNLDPKLLALAAQVARMTRLRRAERKDVEKELTSHFYESVAAGHSSIETITLFGDPKTTARDLRSAAIAKRTPLDRAFNKTLRFAAYSIACIVICYATFGAYIYFQAPVLKLDLLAIYRDSLAKPATESDNAWPLYRKAFLELDLAVESPNSNSPAKEALGNQPFPGTTDWDTAVAWIEAPERRTALESLRAAAARPVFGYSAARELDAQDTLLFGASVASSVSELIATSNDPSKLTMLSLRLPHLSMARNASRVLVTDALRAAEIGDGERFVADIEAVMRLSVHVQDGRILICDLVGIAIRTIAINRTIAALEWKPDLLNGDQLVRLQRTFESVPTAMRRLDPSGELLMWTELEQRLFTDDGTGNGWFRYDNTLMSDLQGFTSLNPTGYPVLSSLWGPASAFIVADRRTTHDFVHSYMKQVADLSALPIRDFKHISDFDQQTQVQFETDPIRLMLPKMMLPALTQAANSFQKNLVSCAAAAATCAALRFRADSGNWPTRAEDLVPKYLAAIPEDPWTGKPILMASDTSGFRMWSMGQDGRDDGGDPLAKDGFETSEPNRCAATTEVWRRDDRTGVIPPIDWVWYAPRGDMGRWMSPLTPEARLKQAERAFKQSQ